MPQLAMQELDDGVGQALPVVHLGADEVTMLAQDLWGQPKVSGEEPERGKICP